MIIEAFRKALFQKPEISGSISTQPGLSVSSLHKIFGQVNEINEMESLDSVQVLVQYSLVETTCILGEPPLDKDSNFW